MSFWEDFYELNSMSLWDRFLLGPPGQDAPVLCWSFESIYTLFRHVVWLLMLFPIYIAIEIWEIFSPKKEKDVTGQVIVITGAGRGMGSKMAEIFVSLGANVVCIDINEKLILATADLLKVIAGNDDQVHAEVCDVSNFEQTQIAADNILNKYGRVDIVIHNAAILAGNTILGADESFIKRMMDVNLLSAFWMIKSFLPIMKQQKCGHIVLMNSILPFTACVNTTVYTTSKAGLIGLMDSLDRELKEDPSTKDIKLTSVHPWWVNTQPQFTKHIKVRFQKDYVSLTPDEAARQIVIGIRREYLRFVVPGIRLSYFSLKVLKLAPEAWRYSLYQCIYHKVNVPDGLPYVPPPEEQKIL